MMIMFCDWTMKPRTNTGYWLFSGDIFAPTMIILFLPEKMLVVTTSCILDQCNIQLSSFKGEIWKYLNYRV